MSSISQGSSDQKLVLPPAMLPGFSVIGSYWLLHMAVLSCTVIGRVDLVEPWLRSRWIPDTQHNWTRRPARSRNSRLKGWKTVRTIWQSSRTTGICESRFGTTMSLLISLPVSENFSSFNSCRLLRILFFQIQNMHAPQCVNCKSCGAVNANRTFKAANK